MRSVILLATLGFLGFAHDILSRPNVIYLNADDLGVMDVGFMGSKLYHTPTWTAWQTRVWSSRMGMHRRPIVLPAEPLA